MSTEEVEQRSSLRITWKEAQELLIHITWKEAQELLKEAITKKYCNATGEVILLWKDWDGFRKGCDGEPDFVDIYLTPIEVTVKERNKK